ncbi:ATP-dependent DNA helicase [Trichonephila clavipes]|nr:ATP-dependent DNA helicase [Trichonephila clavipes]
MIPSDSTIPFKRLQFPIRLAFAMSINKSQGQTMSICGLDLENPCFSHGQLYVACSRVGKPSNLFVLAKDSYTRAFGDGPRNLEPWSSDVDDIRAVTPSPNYHTTPTGGRFSSRQI